MSHYTPMSVVILDKDAALEAMLAMGHFQRSQIEVHDEPQVLYDYGGRATEHKAHLIVRREHLGSLQNDLGVRIGEDGGLFICDYAKNNIGKLWEGNFKARYSEATTIKEAKRQRKKFVRKEVGNKVKIFIGV